MHLTSNDAIANSVSMKTILAILLALSACGDDMAYQPDAAQPDAAVAIDARAADAPTPPPPDASQSGGCMGSLPTSRTITINTGDPIPANLLNEIQDNIVGDFHGNKTEVLAGFDFCVQSGTAVISTSGAITVNSAGGLIMVRLPLRTGDRLRSVLLTIVGDGAVDAAFAIKKVAASGTTTTIASGSFTDVSGAGVVGTGPDVTGLPDSDTKLTAGQFFFFQLAPNAANFSANNVAVTFDRPV